MIILVSLAYCWNINFSKIDLKLGKVIRLSLTRIQCIYAFLSESTVIRHSFLANVILTFTFAICYRLSFCLSSVTLVHPTQPVEILGNFFSPYHSSGTLVFWCQNRWWGTPLSPEICVQSDPPPLKQRNFDQYRLIALNRDS